MTKRKNISNQEKQDLIQNYYTSGNSINSWCRENSICVSTFHGWLKKLKKAATTEPTFIQLKPSNKLSSQIINLQSDEAPNAPLVLEMGRCKLTIPENINTLHLADVLKVVARLDL